VNLKTIDNKLKKEYRIFLRLRAGFRLFLKAILVILFFIMVATVFANVFCRYCLRNSLNWVDEVSRAAFVWMTFFAIVITVWDNEHIGLDNLIARVHHGAGQVVNVIAALLKLVFFLYLLLGGWKLVSLTLFQLTPYLGIPSGYIYAVVPITASLLLIFALRDIFDAIMHKETNR
jgi:TRAP-type C4-dicarboxylate transport system permease small subunit